MISRARMKRNHGCEMPSQIVTIGVAYEETRNESGEVDKRAAKRFHHCYAIAVRRNKTGWYAERHQRFTDPELFWSWIRSITRPREPVTVYSSGWHLNTQLLNFWGELDSSKLRLRIPPREIYSKTGKKRTIKEHVGFLAIDSKPFAVYSFSDNGSIRLCDVHNYFDTDIVEICRSGGIDIPDKPPAEYCELAHAMYTENVAAGLRNVMCRLIDEWKNNNRGNWQPTAARLAMSNFRHEFLKDFDICNIDDKMDREFQRQSFFGGELACYYRGSYESLVHKVDITGLFPSAMLSGMFPVALRSTGRYEKGSRILPAIRPDACTAEVVAICHGDVPMRLDDGSVHYPCGTERVVLCGGELARLARDNRIVEVSRYEEYDCQPIFQRYVAYWWSIRKQAKETQDKASDIMAKLMLNSLYGKFAARSPLWVTIPDEQPPIRYGYFPRPIRGKEGFHRHRAIAGVMQYLAKKEEKNDTFPAVSAFITSASRDYMRSLRQRMPVNSILCQQVDSWLVTDEGFQFLKNSDMFGDMELGKFRHEETYQWVEIYGPNHYIHDKGYCMAGLPPDNVPMGKCHFDTWTDPITQDVIGTGGNVVNRRHYRSYTVRTKGGMRKGWVNV